MKPNNKHILVNGDMSQAKLVSDTYSVEFIVGCAFQSFYSGSPLGTIVLQGSCVNLKPTTDADWTDLTGYTVMVSGGGSALVNVQEPFFKWVRLVFLKDPGSTGVLNVHIQSKGI